MASRNGDNADRLLKELEEVALEQQRLYQRQNSLYDRLKKELTRDDEPDAR